MISNCLRPMLALCISYLSFSAANPGASPKSAYSYYAITGVHTGVDASTGYRPARQPIQVMQESYPMIFDLYIQSLIAMQAAPTTDRTSWFQYAGIHGRPYIPWDNIQQGNGAPPIGYCAHGSILFPTWHRPLLAGLEQILAGHAQSIAATYPLSIRAQYQTAANNFRIPYWDWATNPTIPEVVSSQYVTVNTPTGSRTLTNPLWSYKFPYLNTGEFPSQKSTYDWYLAADPQTFRSPNNQVGGPSNANTANNALNQGGLQYSTYYALTKATSYNNFATQSNWGSSIESVHGNVHVMVGGNWGHMTDLGYAGFDPIFYLHHCNVDRIVALYQAMNPNNFLTPEADSSGTFSLPPSIPYGPGPNDSLTTPLGPFSTDTNGDQWTSAESQFLSTFGYSYPEIEDWIIGQTPAQLAQNVTASVNMIWSSQATPSKSKRSVTGDERQQVIEWSVTLSIKKFELNGQNFLVRLFVGEVPDDSTTWALSQPCIGNFAVLPPRTVPEGPLADVKLYDEISLVRALSNVGYDGQDVPPVVLYLTENFQWRVQLVNGTVVPPDQYPSLEVDVQEEQVGLARNIYELPLYGKKKLHPEITQGKLGGYMARKM